MNERDGLQALFNETVMANNDERIIMNESMTQGSHEYE